MNYLGHAFLSFNNAGILTGNMMGDFIKGKLALEKLPTEIKNGILLHRKIDEFSDRHPATSRGKLMFREDYGLYAGAIMDTLYDHFLASDPKYFPASADLLAFTQKVYRQLEANQQFFAPAFALYYPHMREHNWLYNYRTLKGMDRSLHGLARRAKHMPAPEKAYQHFVTGYYQLNQCYYELIDDLIKFVKIELEKLN